MIKFGRFIAKHRVLILILAVLLLIPSVLGYISTRVNYDVLTYLPDDIDTMVGQDILMDEFGKGGFSMVVLQGMDDKNVSQLREKISKVDGVADVLWYDSIASLSVPKEILPQDLLDKFQNGDSTLMLVFFTEGTSSDRTLQAVQDIRDLAGKQALVGGHHRRYAGAVREGRTHLCAAGRGPQLCSAGADNGIAAAAGPVSGEHRYGHPV